MKPNLSRILVIFFLMVIAFLSNYCQHETSLQPNTSCIDNQPVEDTTRVYLLPLSRDTIKIYPKAIFARFYPWVNDTTKIRQLAEKHHLRLLVPPTGIDQQLAALLCVTDDRRAEYHFTPYGKEGFCNFGADSLVEYAFGVFDNGRTIPSGRIDFRFVDGTPETRIDSLFNTNGLRFLDTSPDFPTGTWYQTLVTPRSKKNFLDLAYELQSVPFARFVDPGFLMGSDLRCD
jgi:hypothetical protein